MSKQNVSSSPLVRLAVWLSAPVTEDRWLIILLWISAVCSAINGVAMLVESFS